MDKHRESTLHSPPLKQPPRCGMVTRLVVLSFVIAVALCPLTGCSSQSPEDSESTSKVELKVSDSANETAAENEEGKKAEAKSQSETDSADDSKETAKLAKNEIAIPFSSYTYSGESYKKAVKALKKAGFTNVKTKVIYNLSNPDGGLFTKARNEVEGISIAGNDSFSENDVFKKNAKVVVEYHKLEYENPKIKWKSLTVAKLYKDLDSNAMKAKKKYEGKYLKITGYLDIIDASGKYITLTPSNSGWDLDNVHLSLKTDAQRNKVAKMKKGQQVTAKVKVDSVGEIMGYDVDLCKFV